MTAPRQLATPDSTTGTGPSQSSWLTAFKLVGVVVSSLLLAALMVRVTVVVATGARWSLVAPAALLGYLGADLLSGTAHWFCDTFFDERTPAIGKILILPFRDHHVHPRRITQYRFIEQDTTNFFIMMPLLLIALQLNAPSPGSSPSLFWSAFLCALALGSYATNLFHKWAHASTVPPGVRWLQRRGLILAPGRHQTHHGDYSKGFCVTSGWMNPLLAAIRFFPRLEAAARSLRKRARPS